MPAARGARIGDKQRSTSCAESAQEQHRRRLTHTRNCRCVPLSSTREDVGDPLAGPQLRGQPHAEPDQQKQSAAGHHTDKRHARGGSRWEGRAPERPCRRQRAQASSILLACQSSPIWVHPYARSPPMTMPPGQACSATSFVVLSLEKSVAFSGLANASTSVGDGDQRGAKEHREARRRDRQQRPAVADRRQTRGVRIQLVASGLPNRIESESPERGAGDPPDLGGGQTEDRSKSPMMSTGWRTTSPSRSTRHSST